MVTRELQVLTPPPLKHQKTNQEPSEPTFQELYTAIKGFQPPDRPPMKEIHPQNSGRVYGLCWQPGSQILLTYSPELDGAEQIAVALLWLEVLQDPSYSPSQVTQKVGRKTCKGDNKSKTRPI
jgi:hypothetical protein